MISFRYMGDEDREYVRTLRNDPVTRMMSRTDKEISEDEHQDYLDTTGDVILVARIGERRIGTLRLVFHPHEVEVGIVVDPRERGKGYSPKMLNLIKTWLGPDVDRPVVGYVRRDNDPSLAAFRSAGWTESDDYVKFVYP